MKQETIPRREARLIVARLLHDILRLGHTSTGDVPFMQSVELLLMMTAIFLSDEEGRPFSSIGLSKHLGMPRATVFRRLRLLDSKEIVRRDTAGLHVNPQIFRTDERDVNFRQLCRLIIDAGIASKMDGD